MIILGVTGSIGMGKSTASQMLETLGIPVHDSDAAVHELMKFGSKGWYAIATAFPYYSYPQIYGRKNFWNPFKTTHRFIRRDQLGKIIFSCDKERKKLENALHPLVQNAQQDFIKRQNILGRKIIALDIPLLFETQADLRVDYTINVTAPSHIQRARVLSRPNMNAKKFEAILKNQMPDGEKCARADFVVHSGLGRAAMMKELKNIIVLIQSDLLTNPDIQPKTSKAS